MYLRKKGEYYQIVEAIEGKQKVLEHLGKAERILELIRLGKEYETITEDVGTDD